MNKRIQELAKEAGAYISEPNDWKMVDFDTSKIDLERFAELIVKECCDIMATHAHRPAGVVKRDVKEHFGVKE